MMEYIIDTNVPLVAQGKAEQMSDSCRSNCVRFLNDLFEGKFMLVIDSDYNLIEEYSHEMSKGNQFDYGNRFLKWIYTNQANQTKIKQVDIHKLDEYNFSEVPQSIVKIGFDNSDRKFIAVAIANNKLAPIAQAADSKWISWGKALLDEGIIVKFLCKAELKILCKKKGFKNEL